jgi:8-oxo-dGTP pyrophosphatase MutT (NUDIX family)
MGMRGAGHRFMPNRLVYPGGRVDRADMRAQPASPLSPAARAGLERAANPALAAALGIAAARELEEETGLSLGSPPALDGLHYLCRAVTPPNQPIRFNARFLVVSEDRVSGALAGSGELENLRFYEIEAAMSLDVPWVTRKVLEHLVDWLAMTPAARAARDRWPVCRSKVWTTE